MALFPVPGIHVVFLSPNRSQNRTLSSPVFFVAVDDGTTVVVLISVCADFILSPEIRRIPNWD